MKNKWLAAILNILPGLGYLYLGVRKLFAVILLLMLPVTIIAGSLDSNLNNSSGSSSSLSWGILVTLATPMIAFMIDAFNEAKRVNELKARVNTEAQPAPLTRLASGDNTKLFVVGLPKFFILFFVTLSFYGLYWTYRNWRAIKVHEKSGISPFWRTILGIFFIFSLLQNMQRILREHDDKADLSTLDRTVAYITISLLPIPWKPIVFIALIKPFILAGVQKKVNRIYAPDQMPSNRLSAGEWVITILGVFLMVGSVIYTFSYLGGS